MSKAASGWFPARWGAARKTPFGRHRKHPGHCRADAGHRGDGRRIPDRCRPCMRSRGNFGRWFRKRRPRRCSTAPGSIKARPIFSTSAFRGSGARSCCTPWRGRSLLFHGFRLFQQKAQAEPGAAEHGLKRRFGRGRAQVQPFDSYHGEEIEYAAGQIGMLYAQLKRFRRR